MLSTKSILPANAAAAAALTAGARESGGTSGDAPEKTYEIQLPSWRGPMELLLELIRSAQLDINEVSLTQLTEDYLKTLAKWRGANMAISSDFLVMAATLVLHKTRSLLGIDESVDEDTATYKEELIKQILMYEKYKKAAHTLEHLLAKAPAVMVQKTPFQERLLSNYDKARNVRTWQTVGVSELVAAFYSLIDKQTRVLTADSFEHFHHKVEEKKKLILFMLDETAAVRQAGIKLETIASAMFKDTAAPAKPAPLTKGHLLASFIALLELYKLACIEARQAEPFGEIRLFPNTARM